jgi:hypothetical protein
VNTPGAGFPVVGPGGERLWWVIPEGGLGQLVNNFTFAGDAKNIYTVKESTTRPSGAVGNPFSTQAEAQTRADQLNAGARAKTAALNPIGNPLTGVNAIGDLATRLTKSETWIRVGEFLAGAMLLFIGVKAFFPGTAGAIANGVKKTGKVVPFL